MPGNQIASRPWPCGVKVFSRTFAAVSNSDDASLDGAKQAGRYCKGWPVGGGMGQKKTMQMVFNPEEAAEESTAKDEIADEESEVDTNQETSI